MQLSKSIAIIIGSTILISGSTALLLQSYRAKLNRRLNHPDYFISLIVQTGPDKNALPTSYLAQLMDLSFDKPTNIYAFSAKEAEKKLLQSPLIKAAHVKPIKPSAVYVEYQVRVPILTLAEYRNIGIDSTGHLFPIEPYLTAKNLPELVLGRPLPEPLFDQIIEMKYLNKLLPLVADLDLKRIDLSDIEAASAGRRQLVLIVGCHTLRLTPKGYARELKNYANLQKKIEAVHDSRSKIIDFRIDDMAFLETLQ